MTTKQEVPLSNEAVTPEQKLKYQKLMARARQGAADRPSGPPKVGLPTFREVEEHRSDPPERPGVPTMTAGELSDRVGVQPSPEAPAEGGVLREETMRGLEALAEAQPVPEEETEDAVADMEAQIRGLMQDSQLRTPVTIIYDEKRRKLIESKIKKIDISDLLINTDAHQTVEIAPDISVVFRSLNGHETDFIEQYVWERFQGNLTRVMYELTRGLVALTLTLTQVGSRTLLEHRSNPIGTVDHAQFEKKWAQVMAYPSFLLEAMDLNRSWFNERCANILNLESVGNG